MKKQDQKLQRKKQQETRRLLQQVLEAVYLLFVSLVAIDY